MNRYQLQELLRLITKSVLKEYISMAPASANDAKDASINDKAVSNDPSAKPADAMTPVEKAKLEREKAQNAKNELANKKKELDTTTKEKDFQKKNVDTISNIKIPALKGDIQKLQSTRS